MYGVASPLTLEVSDVEIDGDQFLCRILVIAHQEISRTKNIQYILRDGLVRSDAAVNLIRELREGDSGSNYFRAATQVEKGSGEDQQQCRKREAEPRSPDGEHQDAAPACRGVAMIKIRWIRKSI